MHDRGRLCKTSPEPPRAGGQPLCAAERRHHRFQPPPSSYVMINRPALSRSCRPSRHPGLLERDPSGLNPARSMSLCFRVPKICRLCLPIFWIRHRSHPLRRTGSCFAERCSWPTSLLEAERARLGSRRRIACPTGPAELYGVSSGEPERDGRRRIRPDGWTRPWMRSETRAAKPDLFGRSGEFGCFEKSLTS